MLEISDPVIQRLLDHIGSDGGKWPLSSEKPILKELNTWVALRDSDKAKLKAAAAWDEKRTTYRIDPVAERISDTWAAYLFGDEPRFQAPTIGEGDKASTPDQPLLEQLLEIGGDGSSLQMSSELERAAGISSSEGEVWSRIFVDKSIADRPLLEWHSRLCVLPLWIGSRLIAAALWTEMPDPNPKSKAVWRHFECHAPGIVVNVLYKGNANSIGQRRELTDHPRTATIDVEEWRHGLPEMLMARIPNKLRGNVQLGVSDYKGIQDYLLDINETAAVGAVNARLTGRKRAVISAAAAEQNDRAGAVDEGAAPTPEQPSTMNRKRVTFDPAEDIFIEDPLDMELGKGTGDPFRILEYRFDAEALIKWKQELVESAITRAGLVAQYVGTNDQTGYAITGTAIRLRLIPTDKTGSSKGRYFDDGLPRIIGNMARLDSLRAEDGGFGREWTNPEIAPKIERHPGIPVDDLEDAQRHGILISNGLESTKTGVKALHREWDNDRVDEEVALIMEERKAATPGAAGSLFGV